MKVTTLDTAIVDSMPQAAVALAIFVVVLVAILPGLGTQHVWSRDEARPALVAKDMLSSGQWLVPHIGRRIDTQKPPLFPWIVALVSPHGVSEWSLRLPSALAAAGTVALTYLLGARLIATAAGVTAAAMLASSFMFYQWARTGRMEMFVALFITLGCWSLIRWLESGRARDAMLLGVWMALGVLAKGPIALLPVVVGAGVIALGVRPPRPARHAAICALTTSSILLSWVGLAWWTSPDFAPYVTGFIPMFVTELTEVHARHMPLLVAGGFLPWTLTLPAATVVLARSWRFILRGLLVPALWIATIAVIFSTVLHPREAYFLPLYPPLAVVVAYAWHTASERWLALLFYPLAAVTVAGVILTAWLTRSAHPVLIPFGDPIAVQMSRSTLAAQILLLLAAALGYIFMRAGKRTLAAVSTAVGILGFFTVVETEILTPALNRTFPTAEAAAELAASIPPSATVAYIDSRHLTAIAFYLPRPSIQLRTPNALGALIGRRDLMLLLVDGQPPLTGDGRAAPVTPIATVRFDGIRYILATFSET